MPYLGNSHIAGDHVNNFKVLDDISSYTATFDGSATSVVDTTNNTIRVVEHRFIQGQRVTYTNGGGGNIGGLTTGTAYFVIYDTAFTIKLATNASNAANSTAINLSSVGSGTSHTLNAAFDGTNTKFKLTHGSGVGARLNNATQLNVAINNVVQRPNVNSLTFTEGFAIEDNHKIVFKVAPTSEDIFWGSIIANTITTFDISDHKIDTFTGDGSTTEFTLTHTPANNESLMVTINGVLQHPSNASTARAYTLIASIIQFTAAPGVGDEIQVRHIGFAGATTADVSGFYGRTGNVVLTDQDDIIVNKISVGTGATIESNGQATFVGVVTFGSSSTTIEGDNNLIKVGTALTLGHTQGLQFHTQNLHSDGFEINNINASGIITASQFVGNIGGNPTFSGDATFNGSVSIGGTLTYEDVTNIDSVGIVTARDGLKVLAGGANVVGVVTATTFKGDGDFVELDVDGHTNLDNVNVAGVSTFASNVDIDGNTTFGASGSITAGANFTLSSNKLRVTGSDTVGIECQRSSNATIQCTETTNNTDLQLRANSTGGLVRTATQKPLILGTYQQERLHLTADGNIQIGTAVNPGDTLRYVDIGNYNTGSSAGSILRLLTVKSDGSSSTSADIVKYKTGGLVINNNEAIGTTGYISFGTATGGGSTTERLRINSSGQLIMTNAATQTFSDFSTTNNSTRGIISVAGKDGSGNAVTVKIGGFGDTSRGEIFTHSNHNLGFATNNAAAQMILHTSGLLDVVGSARATNFYLRGNGSAPSADASIFRPADNTLAFATSSTERLRITSTGQILIGVNNAVDAEVDLQIHSATSGNGPILNMTNNTGDCRIFFGQDDSSGSANAQGQIRYNVASNYLAAYTAGGERLRIRSDGKVVIGTNYTGGTLSVTGNLITDDGTNGRVTIQADGTSTNQILSTTTGFGSYCNIKYQAADHIFLYGGTERLRITSAGQLLIGTTSGGGTLRVFGGSGRLIIGDSNVNYHDADTHIFRNYASSETFRITSGGALQQTGTSGLSYFKGSSEYIFGSNSSSPPAGGYESVLQVQGSKTRSAFTVAAYMNNAGGPFMTFLSSRSGTVGTLGTKCINGDSLGDIRFAGDNATNYNSVAIGAQIYATAASTPGDGDTVIAGRMRFNTGTANAGSIPSVMELREDGQLNLKRGRTNNNGSALYCWGGQIAGSGTLSFDVPVLSSGNIYKIDMFFSHHSLAYGCYRYGVYGAYSGHAGVQINTDFANHSTSLGGSWTITRGNAGTSLVVAKTAGSYGGTGTYFVNVYAGSPTQL